VVLTEDAWVLAERPQVFGIDPTGPTILHSLPVQILPVTAGAGPQTIARDRSIIVTRASLQEDVGLGDADEIQCKVGITPVWLPVYEERWSDLQVLPG
jgi:hypothetical protein